MPSTWRELWSRRIQNTGVRSLLYRSPRHPMGQSGTQRRSNKQDRSGLGIFPILFGPGATNDLNLSWASCTHRRRREKGVSRCVAFLYCRLASKVARFDKQSNRLFEGLVYPDARTVRRAPQSRLGPGFQRFNCRSEYLIRFSLSRGVGFDQNSAVSHFASLTLGQSGRCSPRPYTQRSQQVT